MARNMYEGLGLTPEEEAYVRFMGESQSASKGGFYTTDLGQQHRRTEALKEVITRRGSAGGNKGEASSSSSTSNQSSSSFSGLQDGAERDTIKSLLAQFNSGGTAEYRKAQAERDATLSKIDSQLGDYSKQAAFQDAADAMQLSLNNSMAKNKPIIQKGVEAAGTSASSMQALLAQNMITDASLSAGALGAEQAKSYGQIASGMLATRGGITTGIDQRIDPMTKLADLLKISSSQSTGAVTSQSAGAFDPANMLNAQANMLKAQNADAASGGAAKSWSTYGPDPLNQWMTKKGTLQDQFRTGQANPLDPANNLLYGSNGTY